MGVRVLVFDVFGSLVDWRTGIAAVCREAASATDVHDSALNLTGGRIG